MFHHCWSLPAKHVPGWDFIWSGAVLYACNVLFWEGHGETFYSVKRKTFLILKFLSSLTAATIRSGTLQRLLPLLGRNWILFVCPTSKKVRGYWSLTNSLHNVLKIYIIVSSTSLLILILQPINHMRQISQLPNMSGFFYPHFQRFDNQS